MPELPEVECLTRAVAAVAQGRTIEDIHFFRKDLREPIPVEALRKALISSPLKSIRRRSKYMILETKKGAGLLHLGMTGNLLLRDQLEGRLKHTHFVFQLAATKTKPRQYLHYVDPRRFGRLSASEAGAIDQHAYLVDLGPEPLECPDLGGHLWQASRRKTQAVKAFLMDAQVVVGVGNIYASESLFRAGIRPTTEAVKVSRQKYEILATCIQQTLQDAIRAGGTSFRDYKGADGEPGYFEVQLAVYGNTGKDCQKCQSKIRELRLAGRSTFYCPNCQK